MSALSMITVTRGAGYEPGPDKNGPRGRKPPPGGRARA